MATSAPTSSALRTSAAVWMPVVAASDTVRPEDGAEDGDPTQRQAQLPRAALRSILGTTSRVSRSRSGW